LYVLLAEYVAGDMYMRTKLKTKYGIIIAGLFLATSTQAPAQSAGSSVSLQYGTISAVGVVQAAAKHRSGRLLGGIAGAVIADDHPGLGALAGGLIGGGIEGHATSKKVLLQYTVALKNGGVIVIDTEQRDMVLGDCVVVEQGQYANIRRVSNINCQVDQKPAHHVQAASNCQLAKDELNQAKTQKAVEIAVTKVRTLCED
jgi:outer membrane lipoprotein SlyB